VSDLRLEVNAAAPEHISTRVVLSNAAFTALARNVGTGQAQGHDPQVRVDRSREVRPGEVRERIALSSVLPDPTDVSVTLAVTSDGAAMDSVKLGEPARPKPFPHQDSAVLQWSVDDICVTCSADGATLSLADGDTVAIVQWEAQLPSFGTVTFEWLVEVEDDQGAVLPAPSEEALAAEDLADTLVSALREAGVVDQRVRPWLLQSLSDLNGLRMATRETPELAFFAAGVPWYLTLFGRDSVWAARLLLPVDLHHAATTLATLAHFQGTKVDIASAQSPGKIIHELRRAQFEAAGSASLPPRYYGTIDATPLWICLLHDAWKQGLAEEQVARLLPALQAALEWMVSYGDADGDGFLEYLDESGHGLANQGWKDSGDSIRFADGATAVGPVALCEVQGYAYEAGVKAAAILEAFDMAGAEKWRAWSAELAERFRRAFWCGSGDMRYPALALDHEHQPVDSLTSNIGHLLGTGILSPDEELVIAKLLAGPSMDSGLGLRTMSSSDAGYSPLSYHCGSVWPHDTAIVIQGMVNAGLVDYADGLVEGLLEASAIFAHRLPELWSGEGPAGVPYPAACRPQAWSAASAVTVATAMLARSADGRSVPRP
jgi:glycogen debranching enzyme